MALPAHLRIEPLGAHRLTLALRVGPALAYVVVAPLAIARGALGLPTLSGLLCLALVALGLSLPLAARRVRGLLELGAARAEMIRARALVEAGDAEQAAALYEAAAARLAGRLHANHAVGIVGAAIAHAQLGHAALAREVLDALEASRWLSAFSLRRHRDLLRASIATTRALLGDVAGARRQLASMRPRNALTQQHYERAAALVAARAGDEDASARIDAAIAVGGLGERAETLFLAVSCFLARAEQREERAAARREALRARPRRDYRALAEGWPALHAWLRAEGLDQEAVR